MSEAMPIKGRPAAKVAISIKVMPASPETDLEQVRAAIAKKIPVQDARIEPVAFGLRSLKLLIVAPDTGTAAIEQEIKRIPGVAEVEIESVTLI